MVPVVQSLVARVRRRSLPWFLLGCSGFLYLHLFRLPWTPLFIAGTQEQYLLGGMRMLDGQVIYRDFFDFVAPGTNVIYFVLYKVFGIRAWIPNVMLVVLGVGLVWLTVVISRKIMDGARAFLPPLTFLTFFFRFQLDATHHWYSALAVLAALAVIVEARTPRRLATAAALCGVASFFTQTRGAMAVLGLALFLLWEVRTERLGRRALLKSELILLASFSTATVALYANIIYQAGLARVVNCTVVFLFKYATSIPANNWATLLKDCPPYHPWYRLPNVGIWLFAKFFQPLVYVLCLLRLYRVSQGDHQARRNPCVLLCIVGLFLLLGVIRAPNFQRLSADSLPALILLVWLVDSPRWFPRTARRTLWAAALSLAFVTPLSAQCLYTPHYLDVPAGHIALYSPRWIEQFEWLLPRISAGEYCLGAAFVVGNSYLHLRDPAPASLSNKEFTRPEQVRKMVEALERHQVRWVIWGSDLDVPDTASPEGDHLHPLRAYVHEHYRLVKTFSNWVQVWKRQP